MQLALGFCWKVHSSSKDSIEGSHSKVLAKRKDLTFSFSFFVRCCKYGSSAPAAVGFFMLLVYGMKLFCVGFGSPCAGDEGAAQQGQDERRAESQV